MPSSAGLEREKKKILFFCIRFAHLSPIWFTERSRNAIPMSFLMLRDVLFSIVVSLIIFYPRYLWDPQPKDAIPKDATQQTSISLSLSVYSKVCRILI